MMHLYLVLSNEERWSAAPRPKMDDMRYGCATRSFHIYCMLPQAHRMILPGTLDERRDHAAGREQEERRRNARHSPPLGRANRAKHEEYMNQRRKTDSKKTLLKKRLPASRDLNDDDVTVTLNFNCQLCPLRRCDRQEICWRSSARITENEGHQRIPVHTPRSKSPVRRGTALDDPYADSPAPSSSKPLVFITSRITSVAYAPLGRSNAQRTYSPCSSLPPSTKGSFSGTRSGRRPPEAKP